MGAKLFAIDTVVLGRFNPHIITPPWLAKESIIAEQKAVEAEIAVGDREIAFRFKTGDLKWQVDYNRLIISTEKINDTDTASIAAKVVEILHHTPIAAIGNNFHYRCSLSEWKGRLPKLDDVGFDQLKEYGEVQSVVWKASVSQTDDVTVNAEVSLEPNESLSLMLTVNVNCHRKVQCAADLIAAAQLFNEDRNVSVKFLESLLREKAEQ